MEFILDDYTGELTDDEILQDIRRVADLVDTDYLSISIYKKHGRFSQTAIQGHFGTWINALDKLGIRSGQTRTAVERQRVSDEMLFQDVRSIADFLNKDCVNYNDYVNYGKYAATYIIKRFGTWNSFLIKSGLNPTNFDKHKITQEECYIEIERVWRLLGRQPTRTDFDNGIFLISRDTFKRRFGSWRKALESFVKYINSDEEPHKNEKEDSNSNVLVNNSIAQSSQTPAVKQRRTKREINLRLRFLVMKRDNFKCCICGRSPATTPNLELHIDHIKPWSKGGETVLENLQTLCQDCNLGKSDIE